MSVSLSAPLDVKLMNVTAGALYLLFAALMLAALLAWAVRHPVFAIRGITVQGEVVHTNVVTLRANVMPRLSGGLFTLDLAQARSGFESLPWVRRAVVHRDFPNRLRVQLQEQHTAAFWGAQDESMLVNNFGEVFEANVGEVEQENLPRLIGPEGQAAPMLQMYRALVPQFAAFDATLEQLELSPSGGWRATLESDAVIELGSGTPAEVAERLQRFAQTLTQIASRYGRHADALESADLRYAQGYALRLKGVSTLAAAPSKTSNPQTHR
jgi:cell division protein FtsQ